MIGGLLLSNTIGLWNLKLILYKKSLFVIADRLLDIIQLKPKCSKSLLRLMTKDAHSL